MISPHFRLPRRAPESQVPEVHTSQTPLFAAHCHLFVDSESNINKYVLTLHWEWSLGPYAECVDVRREPGGGVLHRPCNGMRLLLCGAIEIWCWPRGQS